LAWCAPTAEAAEAHLYQQRLAEFKAVALRPAFTVTGTAHLVPRRDGEDQS
jgi:hypothetical protein